MRKLIYIIVFLISSFSTIAQVRWWKTTSGATTWDTAYYDGTVRYNMFLIRLPRGVSSQTPPTPPTCQAWCYLPPGYTTSKKYGLIIDLHGSGEASREQPSVVGDQGAYARRLFKNSFPKLIREGLQPYGINAEGDTIWFIVVCPQVQEANSSSYSRTQIDDMLPALMHMFSINRRYVMLTGLSRGGAGTWSPVLGDSVLSYKFASITPRSAEGYSIGDGVNFSQYIRRGGGIYMSMGTGDAFYSNANSYDAQILSRNPSSGQYYYYKVSGVGHSSLVWDSAISKNAYWYGGLNWWNRVVRWPRQYDTIYAWAGLRDTITGSSITLHGEDEVQTSHTITARQWTKISGPNVTITNGNTQNPTITGLVSNQYYKFRYTVTQSGGLSASDDVEIWVTTSGGTSNQSPIANAGSDQTLTFPSMTASLSGASSNDPDGTIVSYSWVKTSGPSGGTFSAANSVTTNFTVTNAGTYILTLTVTDNNGATATDQVSITFNSEPEEPEEPEYEVSEVICSEYKVAFLKSDGTAWAPYWVGGQGTKAVQYAGGHTFVKGDGGLYNILLLKANGDVYKTWNSTTTLDFLQYDDTGGVFKAIDVEEYLRTDIAIRDDGTVWSMNYNSYRWFGSDVNLVLTSWKKIPGQPNGVNFVKLRKGGETGSGTLYAITDDGDVWGINDNSTTWTQKSFPVPISRIEAGMYNFYVAIGTDSLPYGWGSRKYLGVSGSGNITTYEALSGAWGLGGSKILDIAINDNTIHFIKNDNTLWGLGDDAMGLVGRGQELVNRKEIYNGAWYVWNWLKATDGNYQQIAFVNNPIHITPGRLYTRVFGSNYYTHYKYAQELGTGDLYSWGRNKGAVLMNGKGASNESAIPNSMDVLTPTKVSVFTAVTPSPSSFVPGTIDAGADQTITTNSTTLAATATPGKTNSWTYTISSWQWTKIYGPSCTIASPSSASTVVSGMSNGTYAFQFKVTDNNTATWTDTVIVTVGGAGNLSPTVNAGPNQTTSDTEITMAGSAEDADGTVLFYNWTQKSGPNIAVITDASDPLTTITDMIAGVYVFELEAIDDDGASSVDQVTITINPANIPPSVNAGSDTTITSSEFNLDGTVTDSDGSIAFIEWSQVSGPSDVEFVSPNNADTKVTFAVQGVYVLKLTAFDNSGASSTSQIQIIVNIPDKKLFPRKLRGVIFQKL